MKKKLIRCKNCRRRWRGSDDWNFEFRAGVPQWAICGDCQTPEQTAEAVINEATLDYRKLPSGRLVGIPKGVR